MPAAGGTATQITSAFYMIDDYPSWSPDGSQIAFQREDVVVPGGKHIWVIDVEPPVALDQQSWGKIKAKYRD